MPGVYIDENKIDQWKQEQKIKDVVNELIEDRVLKMGDGIKIEGMPNMDSAPNVPGYDEDSQSCKKCYKVEDNCHCFWSGSPCPGNDC